ncbi:MAG TPA: OsmC family protein [Methylomirabilota bacterium]|nr:OsmC family protein [Methylomirabilota bacterium]
MSVSVILTWDSGLKFDAQLNDRKIQLNSADQMHAAFTPMELFLVSLAGCTAMDVQWILERQRQKVERFEVTANGTRRDEDPRSYESINLEYVISGENVRKDAVERAIRLSREKYCSVMSMVKDSVKLNITYRISEGSKTE